MTSKEFTIVREFDAPRETVWRAWTDPDELAAWWHPEGLLSPRDEISVDMRVGGDYRYVMIDPDTENRYPTGGRYLEVNEPKRLKFTWYDPTDPVDEAQAPVVTVDLEDLGDKTRMTFHMAGIAGEPGDESVHDGWDSAFNELVAHLR